MVYGYASKGWKTLEPLMELGAHLISILREIPS